MAKATLRSKLPQLKAAVTQEADRLVLRAANTLRNNMIRRIMRDAKSGRVYGNHQASAPGEAPANDTGALVRSIRVEHTPGSGKARVVVGSAVGKMLELGTKKMAPRPFMRPSVKELKTQMADLVKSVKITVGGK